MQNPFSSAILINLKTIIVALKLNSVLGESVQLTTQNAHNKMTSHMQLNFKHENLCD